MILNFNRMNLYLCLCFAAILSLFTDTYAQSQPGSFEVYAHRGFRGLHPENTIKGMQKALTYGAILELDLAITKDKQVVVTHDPVLNPKTTQGPDGQALGNDKKRIYQMDYESVRAYDIGSKPNPDFPEQDRYPAHIPLFSALVDSVEAFAAAQGIAAPTYFIETKLNPKTDGINHPGPKEFVDLMMRVVQAKGIRQRIIVQSFDPRTLQILRKAHPQIKLAFLAKDGTSLDDNLNWLGFVPEYYSINAQYIDRELVDRCDKMNIKLIVGNCDDYKEILRIAKLGVNRLISDFPMDRLSKHQDEQKETTKTDWKYLFNGKTLQGWKAINGHAKYVVEDAAIVGTMTKGGSDSFLITDKKYGDFILELEVKLEGENTSSGIQIRSHIDASGKGKPGQVYGRQVAIDASGRAWTGGIYDEGRRGWLYPLDINDQAKTAYKPGRFNRIRIEATGDELRTWVNDVPVAFLIDTLDQNGFIGLQIPRIPGAQDGKKVYFKNIRIQTDNLRFRSFPVDIYAVNLKPNNLSDAEQKAGYKLLFNGKDATGWRSIRGEEFPDKKWEVKNGEIKVLKADGGESGNDIITKEQFSAFDLSFEFKLTPGANSGVKYFVTLKDKTKGSAIGPEFQILDDQRHPDAKKGKNGNRTLGSLYDLITSNRDEKARREIGEWNRGRIVATADRSVIYYLNGVKMLTYKRDSRAFKDLVALSKYKTRPNFGEAESGHILLQDHGDQVSFRSIKVRRLTVKGKEVVLGY